jgi:hypothetical protein
MMPPRKPELQRSPKKPTGKARSFASPADRMMRSGTDYANKAKAKKLRKC